MFPPLDLLLEAVAELFYTSGLHELCDRHCQYLFGKALPLSLSDPNWSESRFLI